MSARSQPLVLPPTVEAAEELLRRHIEARDRIRDKLEKLSDQLDAGEGGGRDWVAYNSLERSLRTAEADVVQSEFMAHEVRRTTPVDLSEEDYLAELRMVAEAMPEPHLAAVADVWLCRHQLYAAPLDEALAKRVPRVLPSVVEGR